MQYLVERLRADVERFRVSTGAANASAFLLSPWLGGAEPLILHTGTGAPVAELSDIATAQRLYQCHATSAGLEAAASLRIIPSATPGGVLLPVPSTGPLSATRSSPFATGRRLADSEPPQLAGWLGLRLEENSVPMQAALAPTRLDEVLRLAHSLAHTFIAVHTLRGDPLTGLPGRAELYAVVRDGLRQAADQRHAFSVLLVNPDDFERINEEFGRSEGDRALREIVVRVRGALRADDLVLRYGAAIFALVLPATSSAHAIAVGEKLRRAVSSVDYLAGRVRLRMSVGVGTWQSGDADLRDPIESIQRADTALARAKRDGGDRCAAWSDQPGDRSAPRLDRLGGVFTGDQNRDYRNLALLWDALTGAWSGDTPSALASRFADQLSSVLRPSFVAIFPLADGTLGESLATRSAARGGADVGAASRDPVPVDLDLLRRACQEGAARHVVRDDNRVLAVPVKAGAVVIGGLLMIGPPQRLRADASDLTFLEGFAGGMGIAIDRARLASQERERLERDRQRMAGELTELRAAVRQARLVHESRAVDDVVFEARKVADTDATVIITGESGTGKGLLAETIHHMSRRRRGPFVVVDCSAIPTNLVESELFGHERGAFTGALSRSPGRVVQADGGTLFLDEVGELPLEVQAKLLRLVEDKQFTSVGSHQSRRVNVRVIAATNRDLLKEVDAGRFRLDLYHRLSVVPLELPPLRDRDQDVLLLARHFLASFSAKYQKPACRLSPELERQMLVYRWPGNVRELQNRLLRAVLLADDETLTPAQLALPMDDAAATGGTHANRTAAPGTLVSTTEHPRGARSPQLSEALATAVDAVVHVVPHMRPPLGRWLADDLVLVAFDECRGIGRRAAATLGGTGNDLRPPTPTRPARRANGAAARVLGGRENGRRSGGAVRPPVTAVHLRVGHGRIVPHRGNRTPIRGRSPGGRGCARHVTRNLPPPANSLPAGQLTAGALVDAPVLQRSATHIRRGVPYFWVSHFVARGADYPCGVTGGCALVRCGAHGVPSAPLGGRAALDQSRD